MVAETEQELLRNVQRLSPEVKKRLASTLFEIYPRQRLDETIEALLVRLLRGASKDEISFRPLQSLDESEALTFAKVGTIQLFQGYDRTQSKRWKLQSQLVLFTNGDRWLEWATAGRNQKITLHHGDRAKSYLFGPEREEVGTWLLPRIFQLGWSKRFKQKHGQHFIEQQETWTPQEKKVVDDFNAALTFEIPHYDGIVGKTAQRKMLRFMEGVAEAIASGAPTLKKEGGLHTATFPNGTELSLEKDKPEGFHSLIGKTTLDAPPFLVLMHEGLFQGAGAPIENRQRTLYLRRQGAPIEGVSVEIDPYEIAPLDGSKIPVSATASRKLVSFFRGEKTPGGWSSAYRTGKTVSFKRSRKRR